MGIGCEVIAPSLIPTAPGDRIKTDTRDCRRLARLHRAGELVAIRIPTLLLYRGDAMESRARKVHELINDAQVMTEQTVAADSDFSVRGDRRAVVDEGVLAYRNMRTFMGHDFDRYNGAH